MTSVSKNLVSVGVTIVVLFLANTASLRFVQLHQLEKYSDQAFLVPEIITDRINGNLLAPVHFQINDRSIMVSMAGGNRKTIATKVAVPATRQGKYDIVFAETFIQETPLSLQIAFCNWPKRAICQALSADGRVIALWWMVLRT